MIAPVVANALREGGRVALLGDFNATGDVDRRSIATLAQTTGARWATEGLACTSYWARRDGCLGQSLDHALTNVPRHVAVARGPCESVGCSPGATCPVFRDEVSDHCPVTLDLQ